jgi:hypothetical protein
MLLQAQMKVRKLNCCWFALEPILMQGIKIFQRPLHAATREGNPDVIKGEAE